MEGSPKVHFQERTVPTISTTTPPIINTRRKKAFHNHSCSELVSHYSHHTQRSYLSTNKSSGRGTAFFAGGRIVGSPSTIPRTYELSLLLKSILHFPVNNKCPHPQGNGGSYRKATLSARTWSNTTSREGQERRARKRSVPNKRLPQAREGRFGD